MSKQNSGRLPMWKKIIYGTGNAGGGFIWGMVSTYILLYCSNVVGISLALVGTLLMVAKVFDGITDVFMGRVIDLTHSKMGKTRFWYLVSCFPLGLCMFLLFNVPAGAGTVGQAAWIFIFYLLISAVFYTMNQVAYNMMVARVTKVQHDQITMSGAAMIGGTIGSVVVASLTSSLVVAFGDGQKGWTMTALVFALIGVVILLLPFFVLRELPEEEFETVSENGQTAAVEKISFLQTVKELLLNKYFILILLLYMVGYFNSGVMTSSMAYFSTYSLGNSNLTGVLGMCTMVPLIIGIPFMPKLMDKTGMRKACVYGSIVSVAGCIVALIGLNAGIAVVIVGLLIKGFGIVPGSATYTPFLVQADEYHFVKNGHRVTGSLFSCATVGNKIGQGIGTAVCGWVLALCGYDGSAAVQSSGAIAGINALYLAIPLACTVVTAVIYSRMKTEEDIKKLKEA